VTCIRDGDCFSIDFDACALEAAPDLHLNPFGRVIRWDDIMDFHEIIRIASERTTLGRTRSPNCVPEDTLREVFSGLRSDEMQKIGCKGPNKGGVDD
jgi:hypothetical protein